MIPADVIVPVGAVCFGLVAGYVTYRTLVRTTKAAAIGDLSAVLSAIGGGVVTKLFDPTNGTAFGWYAIGLPIGMLLYVVTLGALTSAPAGSARRELANVLGAGTETRTETETETRGRSNGRPGPNAPPV